MRVLSYNIHKGFSTLNRRFVLSAIKRAISEVGADLVFLQEVGGDQNSHSKKIDAVATSNQLEFLADQIWPHFAYGKNAIYSTGHHGNAILSHYPVTSWENVNISTNSFENRGLLHAVIEISQMQIHCICLHLDLLESGRQRQISLLASRINSIIPVKHPLIVAGDFNDWKGRASDALFRRVKLREAYFDLHGCHARTFPSWLPVLRLDRIHYRGLDLVNVGVLSGNPWNRLSDHFAVWAEFKNLG